MTELPEVQQARAVTTLAADIERRDELRKQLSAADETVMASAVAAAEAGVAVTRVITMCGISPKTWYGKWRPDVRSTRRGTETPKGD